MKASVSKKPQQITEKTSDQMKRQKNKKILITLLIIVGCFILVFLISNTILEAVAGNSGTPSGGSTTSYIFYEADFDEDITLDKAYMELDRSVYFCDPSTGITSNSMDDIPLTYRRYVEFIAEYINYAIEGKYSALNRMFGENYYRNGGEEKAAFTPQKIYNILITYKGLEQLESSEEIISGSSFWVEYMIRKNNGTFRNDMPSDCTRKQLFTISEIEGKLQIESVYSVFTVEEQTVLKGCGSSTSFVTLATFCAAASVISRKKKEY